MLPLIYSFIAGIFVAMATGNSAFGTAAAFTLYAISTSLEHIADAIKSLKK